MFAFLTLPAVKGRRVSASPRVGNKSAELMLRISPEEPDRPQGSETAKRRNTSPREPPQILREALRITKSPKWAED